MAKRVTSIGDFTPQAGSYAKARPDYPASLFDQLIAHTHMRRDDPVADIGAGTGLFTNRLAERGLLVTALEPNEAMVRVAVKISRVQWRDGTFESTGLPYASQRWITAAQSFHWADPPRALPELRRILVPAGHLTVLWNDRDSDRSPILQRTWRLILEHVPDFDERYRNKDWSAVLTSTGDFTDAAYHEVRHIVRMSRDRYLHLWQSHNRLNAFTGSEGFAALLDQIGAMLDAERVDAVDVPYTCRAWTVRRT